MWEVLGDQLLFHSVILVTIGCVMLSLGSGGSIVEFALANNSACYTENRYRDIHARMVVSCGESKSGERGIFNREASQNRHSEMDVRWRIQF